LDRINEIERIGNEGGEESIRRWDIGGYHRGRLDNGAEDPADEAPDDVACVEKMIAENEHEKEDAAEEDAEDGPSLDVEGAVGRMFVAHGKKLGGRWGGGKGEKGAAI
jgi:hypothetical protein